jgi:hypothetical protein
MVHQKLFAVGVVGWVMAGCALQAEGTAGDELSDVKPEDGSEFAGNQFGSAQQAHALHYTDGTNLWQETGYPMGTDNPNCKDWWVYDRYISVRPKVGTTKYSTYDTSHPWAQGQVINDWMATLPTGYGWYNSAWNSILVDHNSVVARASGKCSGRYVFQVDNNAGSFGANAYFFSANIPSYLIPAPDGKSDACKATGPTSVPAVMVDLYACEAPTSASVGGTTTSAIGNWCSRTSGHWRKVGSAFATGWWNSVHKRCDVGTGVYYPAPVGKVAVSFNMVIKAGIGHGVAPAEIYVLRYN